MPPGCSHWDSNWPLLLLDHCKTRCTPQLCAICHPYPEGSCSLEVKDVRGKRVTLPWLWRASYGNRRLDFPMHRQMAQHPTAQGLPPKLSWHEKISKKKSAWWSFQTLPYCFTDPSLETSPFLFIYPFTLCPSPFLHTPNTCTPSSQHGSSQSLTTSSQWCGILPKGREPDARPADDVIPLSRAQKPDAARHMGSLETHQQSHFTPSKPLLWHCSAGTAPGQGRSGPMEALILLRPLSLLLAKSAQSGRRLFLSASSLGPKTGRNWERKRRERKNTTALFWLVFQETQGWKPLNHWHTGSCSSPSALRPFPEEPASCRRPQEQSCWVPAVRSSSPRCLIHPSRYPSWASVAAFSPAVCSDMENASAERKELPASLLAHLRLPAPQTTCRRLPCFEGKGSFLHRKKEQLCSKVRHQHSRGECSGSQRSDSHSLTSLWFQLGSLQNLCLSGAILDEDGKLEESENS